MAVSDSDERFVSLRDGPIVPKAAYLLLLELEQRKFSLTREGETTLVVQPAERLTVEDSLRIRRWKFHLLGVLRHCERGGVDAHLFRDDGARGERRVS